MRLSPAKCLACVLIGALGLRLAAGWGWQAWLDRQGRGPFGFGDSDGYWVLAQEIARGEPYQYGPEGLRVFRTPGYPALLAPLFLVSDDPPIIRGRAVSAVLDTAAVAAVGWLAWRLFNPWAGVCGAAMAAFYPESVAAGILVLSEAPFCPLMLLHLGLWMAAWQSLSPIGLALGAGVAAGAATLMRPDWLLFIPFAVAIGLLFGRPRLRHLGLGAAMLLGLAAAMAPWWIRNARVTGHFVPTTLQLGAGLYDGWNPGATGAGNWDLVEPAAKRLRDQIVAADPSAGASGEWEYRLDARLRAEALDWALANPGRAAELAAVKLVRMWNFWPNEPGLSAWPIRWGVAITYLPVLILGIWGAIKTIRRGWPYVLCWLPAVYFTLLHMVFVSSIRYRQPAMLGLMVLASGVVGGWNKLAKEGRP
jgi:4-amino-4-deoxy-L-arabinose transferase-like glycosyltransferase